MATVREYYDAQNGNRPCLEMAREAVVDGSIKVRYDTKIIYEIDAGVKYIAVHIAACAIPDGILAVALNELGRTWEEEGRFQIQVSDIGMEERQPMDTLPFSGRIIVFSDTAIEAWRWGSLDNQMNERGLNLIIRDPEWTERKDKLLKPAAFISHDSRDKQAFVAPLVRILRTLLLPIWYDEFALKPGDSLRESIQSGLKECDKCVVVLSKNFFSNKGWTKREFNGIYQREILESRGIMIPIWLDVTKEEVFDYSPDLLDTFGIPASIGVDAVARKLATTLNWIEPKETLYAGEKRVMPGEKIYISDLPRDGKKIPDG